MKKNRSFSRHLKREIKELRRENERLQRSLVRSNQLASEYYNKYTAIRCRVRKVSKMFSISEREAFDMRRIGLQAGKALLQNMLSELAESKDFIKMCHMEKSTRNLDNHTDYVVSLEILTPLVD